MKKNNHVECPTYEESVSQTISLPFRNLFSNSIEYFIETWIFLVIATMFCILSVFHYGLFPVGYWIIGFISDYIAPLYNLISGK